MTISEKEQIESVVLLLQISVGVIYLIGSVIYFYTTQRTVNISIKEKYIVPHLYASSFMVVDDNNNNYVIVNSFLKFNFKSHEVYSAADGKFRKYVIYGYRNSWLGTFPCIIDISKKMD